MSLQETEKWLYGFLSLGIFAMIAVVILTSVRTSVTVCGRADAVLNSTINQCVNSTMQNTTLGSFTHQYNISTDGANAVINLTNQFGTAGTLVGLGILALAAIVIVGYFGFGKDRAK